jgi:hypothetical protein
LHIASKYYPPVSPPGNSRPLLVSSLCILAEISDSDTSDASHIAGKPSLASYTNSKQKLTKYIAAIRRCQTKFKLIAISSSQTPKTTHKQALTPIFRGFSADQAVQWVRKLKYTGQGVNVYALKCALFSF